MMVAYGHFQLRAKVIDPHDLHIFGDFFFQFFERKILSKLKKNST